jgi:poly-gamma-glutamate capsule biosynthesis protein CapA/YwtB (metallophosphatase superfamily)
MKGESETDLAARRSFAHKMIDECGVDLIYGHSSHHARGMELYHNKLILYGTGDIINDYEGFENPGEERYNRLGGIYVVDVDPSTGNFKELRVVPMFMNRLRLERFTSDSAVWKPNARRLQRDPRLSQNFCDFINNLSEMEAGGSGNALILEHFDSDPQIPGGPVLRSKQLG